MPLPTHHHIPRAGKTKLNNFQFLHSVTRTLGSKHHYGAPLRPVTIGDAISDLVSLLHFTGLGHLHSSSRTLQEAFDWFVLVL